jgi:hypothetical protein
MPVRVRARSMESRATGLSLRFLRVTIPIIVNALVSHREREREAAFVEGNWHDDLMMAVLNREYAEIEHSKARLV